MRVISKDEVERKHKCPVCKSVIAYKQEDIFLGFWDKKKIKCPVCEEHIDVSIFDRKVKRSDT